VRGVVAAVEVFAPVLRRRQWTAAAVVVEALMVVAVQREAQK
jgi:hypothetical protein